MDGTYDMASGDNGCPQCPFENDKPTVQDFQTRILRSANDVYFPKHLKTTFLIKLIRETPQCPHFYLYLS
jgi:hypothetical protein